MRQEMFVYRVGKYDRILIINKRIAELNERGWRVLSIDTSDEGHVSLLAEEPENRVQPPSVAALTDEQIAKAEFEQRQRQLLVGDIS
jgi:hypothetical protein